MIVARRTTNLRSLVRPTVSGISPEIPSSCMYSLRHIRLLREYVCLSNVGSLHTPHHQMHLRCKSMLEKLSDTEDEILSVAIEEEESIAASPSKPQTHSITLKHSRVCFPLTKIDRLKRAKCVQRREMGSQDHHRTRQSAAAERQKEMIAPESRSKTNGVLY